MIRVLPRCKPSRPAWATRPASITPRRNSRVPAMPACAARPVSVAPGARQDNPHSRAADLLGRGLGERQYVCFRRAVNGLVRAGLEAAVEAAFKIAPRRRSSIPGRSKAVSAVSAATLASIISNCLEEAVAPASDGAHRRSDPSGSNADHHQVKS